MAAPGPNNPTLNDLWYEAFLVSSVVSGQIGIVVVNPDGTSIGSGGGGGSLSARYNATLPTLSDGATNPIQEDQNGRLIVTEGTLLAGEDLINNVLGVIQKPVVGSQYDASTYQSLGTSVSANVKGIAGNIYSAQITNVNSALRYFQLFNSISIPSGGATPILSFIIGAGAATQPAYLYLDTNFFAPSTYFSTGITFGISTTLATYTAATSADHQVTINYV